MPATQLAQHVSEAGNPGNKALISYAEVGLPRKLLSGGLVLVDTPGVGGLGSAHGAATMSALPSADAVLLVSDAAQEYTAPELEFLDAAMKLCPNVACVLTKTDLYPHWRRIEELDRGHLRKAGVDAEIFPVSSVLRAARAPAGAGHRAQRTSPASSRSSTTCCTRSWRSPTSSTGARRATTCSRSPSSWRPA